MQLVGYLLFQTRIFSFPQGESPQGRKESWEIIKIGTTHMASQEIVIRKRESLFWASDTQLISEKNAAESHLSTASVLRRVRCVPWWNSCMARTSSDFVKGSHHVIKLWEYVVCLSTLRSYFTPQKIKSLIFLWGFYPSAILSHLF